MSLRNHGRILKLGLVALVLVLFAGAYAPSAHAQNLVLNPSFEADCSGVPCNWQGLVGSVARDTSVAHSGVASLRVTATTAAPGTGAAQATCITTVPTGDQLASFWYRAPTGTSLRMELTFYTTENCATGSQSPLAGVNATGAGDTWQQASGTVTVPTGTRSIGIVLFVLTAGATAYFDDVFFGAAPTVTVTKVCGTGVTGNFTLQVYQGGSLVQQGTVTCPAGGRLGPVPVTPGVDVSIGEGYSGDLIVSFLCRIGATEYTGPVPAAAVVAGADIQCTVTNVLAPHITLRKNCALPSGQFALFAFEPTGSVSASANATCPGVTTSSTFALYSLTGITVAESLLGPAGFLSLANVSIFIDCRLGSFFGTPLAFAFRPALVNGGTRAELALPELQPGANVFCTFTNSVPAPVVAAVTFRSLTASPGAAGVRVRWSTASELDTLGFNVYRESNGRRVRVNTRLIAASGRGSYSVLDRKAPKTKSVLYWIQVVDADGSRSWYGPARVGRRL